MHRFPDVRASSDFSIASMKVCWCHSAYLVASMSMCLSMARYLSRAASMVEIVVRLFAILGAGVGSEVTGGCWLLLSLVSNGGGVLAIAGGWWDSCG